ncbi:MAG: ABC transporter substrate-binding protein [Rhodospirillales bacterium]|nr:ABC transporter substrate-binding protein [Rhodospirillales bacterium]
MDRRDLSRVHSGIPKLAEYLEQGKLDRREFLRMTTLLGLSAGAAYALAGRITGDRAIPVARAETPKKGGVAKISMRVHPYDNPHTYSWIADSNVARQANEYLTRTGPDNVTRPALLEKWEASDDLKTWTLHLRKDVNWSNGEPLVADHVMWNLGRLVDPAVGSSVLGLVAGYLLKEVDTGKKDDQGNPVMTTELWDANAIEKVDDHTIRLNAKAAQLAVPEHLFHYPALIIHPQDGGKWGPGALGTGAFELVEIEVNKKAVLRARKSYWGEGPYLDGVEFIDHGDDPNASVNALESGQVHGLFEMSITLKSRLEQIKDVEIRSVATGQTAVGRMQPIHKPFDDPRVRKAFRLALDTEKVLQVAHLGLGAPGEHHHVAPIHPEYAKLAFMKQDIAAAKTLLAEAGYPDGVTVDFYGKKDPDWEPIAMQAMVQMWKQAGINVNLKILPSSQFWEIWDKETHPFAFTTWTHRPLGVMVLGLAYRTGVPWNESKWSNKRFDDLLTKAEGTLDVEARRAIMSEIETLMQEEGPIVQPLWRAVPQPFHKSIKGHAAHPTSYFFCENWWLEA